MQRGGGGARRAARCGLPLLFSRGWRAWSSDEFRRRCSKCEEAHWALCKQGSGPYCHHEGVGAPGCHIKGANNAAVSTTEKANCMGVIERTFRMYHQVSKCTCRKVAEAMVANLDPNPATNCMPQPNPSNPLSLLPNASTDAPNSCNATSPVLWNANPILPHASTHVSNAVCVTHSNQGVHATDATTVFLPTLIPVGYGWI